MKALIVYFSLTGHTRTLAGKLAEALGCEAVALPVFGSYKLDEGHDYDLVVVGAPIWLYRPAFPVSRFLSKNKSRLPEVAFFCTYDTSVGKSFEKMGRGCGKKPLGTLKVMGSEIGTAAGNAEIKQFIDHISRGLQQEGMH